MLVSFSFLQETSKTTVLSTLKKAEKEDRFVLRFFNPTEAETQGAFTVNRSIEHVQEGNLNERPIAPLKLEDNHFNVPIKQNQVKTVLF
ncbi:glycosyl hydrolase-related protein [Neobacillus sp. B4I6]|uniref:glycosyl hydrolase-related protein n=1 Tax=Neobacillus sp. B4I6 TaxID=3373925 RepID=UPI003D1E57A4